MKVPSVLVLVLMLLMPLSEGYKRKRYMSCDKTCEEFCEYCEDNDVAGTANCRTNNADHQRCVQQYLEDHPLYP
uniref:Gsp_26 putative toxin n=1 Tax=Gemmula speciosa TaxID=439592 RepID=A0A098LW83_GEMSP